jgi:GNAT superfamily N-acetyltransferase
LNSVLDYENVKNSAELRDRHTFMRYSRRKAGFSVNTDRALLQNSLCFGLYEGEKQVGFARVVTDYCLFAYLFDVFVDEKYRGKGLGKFLVETVMEHPELLNVNWTLRTTDAQGLYENFGFQPAENPERILEKKRSPLQVEPLCDPLL